MFFIASCSWVLLNTACNGPKFSPRLTPMWIAWQRAHLETQVLKTGRKTKGYGSWANNRKCPMTQPSGCCPKAGRRKPACFSVGTTCACMQVSACTCVSVCIHDPPVFLWRAWETARLWAISPKEQSCSPSKCLGGTHPCPSPKLSSPVNSKMETPP